MSLSGKPVKAVLLDVAGVLKDSIGDNEFALEGSVEAVNRLRKAGMPIRFVTNNTTSTRSSLVSTLKSLGFDIELDQVFPPAPAVCLILKQRGLRPHLLVHPDLDPDFAEVDQTNPNCVVLGDAMDMFSYGNMNKAFQTLIALDKPVLFAMGQGRYYKEDDALVLDVGPFMAALEYACEIKAEVVGKPTKSFYQSVLDSMGATPEETVMVGDDIDGDVGGAQQCGMRAVLVRTGKYLPSDEKHPSIKPDAIADNLAAAVDLLLQ